MTLTCGVRCASVEAGVRCRWAVARLAAVMGTIVKFPDEGRIVRFGRVDAPDESATVIILPVIRIERHGDQGADAVEPYSPPPADNGGRRRVRRR
jgi:hypothetical protein